jgi:hypothetical protein
MDANLIVLLLGATALGLGLVWGPRPQPVAQELARPRAYDARWRGGLCTESAR